MIPIYLYIENFFSHERSEIDFSSFSSALVVGKVDNNDLMSNGVGKTSVFRAIEYALFNQVRDPLLQKDIILEKLIRDDAQKVSVIFDFAVDNDLFRVVRSRTRKGVSDLSFYKRTAVKPDISAHKLETDKELWEDLSSRRTQDTEADLTKKIKSNYKSFINTNHFMQGDLSGVAIATPEKRKMILKESLELMVYAKLEEMAKDHANNIMKEIDKSKAVVVSIGNPQKDIGEIKKDLLITQDLRDARSAVLILKKAAYNTVSEQHTEMLSQLNVLESKSSDVTSKYNALLNDVSKLEVSIQEYSSKRKSIITLAKALTEELTALKNHQNDLGEVDSKELMFIDVELNRCKEEASKIQIVLATTESGLQECAIPLPADGTCKYCRQLLTEAHRRACVEDLVIKQKNYLRDKERQMNLLASCRREIKAHSLNYLELDVKIKEAEKTKLAIASKEKDLSDNKKLYIEYNALVEKFVADLNQKKLDLVAVEIEVQNSSVKETNELKQQMAVVKMQIARDSADVLSVGQALTTLQSKIAVLEHSIEQKTNDIKRKFDLEKTISEAEAEYVIYPDIMQAFGSTGIPNLIIQNVLEDLQAEANNLLTQMRPGLQLSFSTEKTRGDGALADTLEINYFLNNKARDYSQLSGAQRLCIAFSLKLGLSFLLKNMMGSQIKFLLLDEVDQSLDKAGVDAFADIIKLFQKDFKILVITHNDRLKDKFSHAILVEQDQNMVSRARVVTSW